MNRRKLLLFLGSISAASLTRALPGSSDTGLLLSRQFTDIDSLARLAPYCNDYVPSTRSGLLIAAGIDPAESAKQQAASFSAKRRSDFLDGRVFRVNGWMLAESECAVCVLTSRA